MASIPASDIVDVVPNVLDAGGNALDANGVALTTNARVPIGAVQPFSNASDVGDYFGPDTDEKAAADTYFLGFDDSSVKPGSMLFAQYPTAKVAAFLRGADVSETTLAELQAMTGDLTITVDGFQYAASAVNLSAATSFSSAATIIATALDALAPTGASFTGALSVPPSGIPTLTVTVLASGTIKPGAALHGASVPAGDFIVAQLTGTTGGLGTYRVAQGAVVGSEAMTTTSAGPTVVYDSVSGGFVITSPNTGAGSTIGFASQHLANLLSLTQDGGAVISQGANAATPGPFMDALVAVNRDWMTFSTLFDPDGSSGNTQKLAFAAWANATGDRFAYIEWDTDASPAVTVPATTSLGYLLQQSDSSGTCPIWTPSFQKAVFISGAIASIDFDETNGRTNLKFRKQTGQVPDVTDETTADNLRANGYNFYGRWGTDDDKFSGFAEGTVSGPFQWLDSYINQIWLTSALQQALMSLLFNIKSFPYNTDGDALGEAACADPINRALNFGAIRAGVTLSAAQIAEVNSAAGVKIDDTITQQGWYLQFSASKTAPQVRAARGTPPAKLWYTDGQSVNTINLTSIAIQ